MPKGFCYRGELGHCHPVSCTGCRVYDRTDGNAWVMRTESTAVSPSEALPPLDTCSRLYLEVLLHAAQELAIDLAGLGVAQPLALGLAQPVLKDPAVLVGSLQFVAHFLKLTSVLLEETVPHLVHLCPQLIYLVLAPGREGDKDATGGSKAQMPAGRREDGQNGAPARRDAPAKHNPAHEKHRKAAEKCRRPHAPRPGPLRSASSASAGREGAGEAPSRRGGGRPPAPGSPPPDPPPDPVPPSPPLPAAAAPGPSPWGSRSPPAASPSLPASPPAAAGWGSPRGRRSCRRLPPRPAAAPPPRPPPWQRARRRRRPGE